MSQYIINWFHCFLALCFFFFSVMSPILAQTEKQNNEIESLLKLSWESRNNNPSQALIYAKKATLKCEQTKSSPFLPKALAFQGVAYRNQGQLDSALYYHFLSLDIAKEQNNKERIGYAYVNIGNVYFILGAYEEAITYLYQGQNSSEKLGLKELQAYALVNLARIFTCQNQNEQATKQYMKALAIRKELKDEYGLSVIYTEIAKIFIQQENYTDALELLAKGLGIVENLGEQIDIATNNNIIGHAQIELKQYAKANNNFETALEIYTTVGDKQGVAESLLNIAELKAKKFNYTQAIATADSALQIAKEMKFHIIARDASKLLYEIYLSQKKINLAFDYLLIHKQFNDSILKQENSKKIVRLEMQNSFEKQRKIDQQIAENKIKNQRKIKNIFIIGFIIILIFSLLLLLNIHQIRRKNFLLDKQNKKIIKQKQAIIQHVENLRNANKKITLQKSELAIKQIEITSSINYASKIQTALLPGGRLFEEYFSESFILYFPRDIVSGDFYFGKKIGSNLLLAVADCTGHGVPGAFVSMLGIALLNEITIKTPHAKPSEILETLRRKVKTSLKQTGTFGEQKDGIDMAFCSINLETKKLQYAGAFNPVYIIRNKELQILKSTRNPIGIYPEEIPFANQEFDLIEHDKVYMFTDGFYDQIGGDKNEKYKKPRFRKLILESSTKTMAEQRTVIENEFSTWKTDNQQTDDMLMIGFKV